MARKSKYGSEEKGAELEELMDTLETLLERTKILYEQYFMGIQKIPPAQLHKDIERKIRELTQEQIRNTAMRFRLTTITQKFGSYNTYWKRTMQSIEQGRYTRDINRARRKAQRQGEDIPDELLANMPKAMRDRIRRDRAKVAEVAEVAPREQGDDEAMIFDSVPEERDTEDWDIQRLLDGLEDAPAPKPARPQVHQIDDDDDDILGDRIDELFAAITDEPPRAAPRPAPARPAPTPARPAPIKPEVSPPARMPSGTIERTPAPPPVQAAPQPRTPPAGIERTPPPQPVQATQPRTPPGTIERTPPPQPVQATPPRPPQPRAVPDVPARPAAAPPRAVPDIAARPAAPPAAPPAARPATRPATPAPAARPAPAAVPPPPGMTEAETRSLYEQYRQARQLVGGEDISYDRLKQKLNEQAPRIMQQYKAKGLQYDVVVKDDKVVLKATPKRGE